MEVMLPVDEMTTEEKLRAMEVLWASLTQNEDQFESPSWHEKVLREREERMNSGQEIPIDWEVAKKQLRDELT